VSIVTIQSPTQILQTPAGQAKKQQFVVRNNSGAKLRISTRVQCGENDIASWVSMDGPGEIELEDNTVTEITVIINVPEDAPSDRYAYRLVVFDARDTSCSVQSEQVFIQTLAVAKKINYWWWIIAGIAALVVLTAMVTIIVVSGSKKPVPRPAPPPIPRPLPSGLSVVELAANNHPAVPSGMKVSCMTDGNTVRASSTCPVLKKGNVTYWAYSYVNNRVAMGIVAYRSGRMIKSWQKSGARYVWKITIDSHTKTVNFWGQSNKRIIMPWSELE